MQRLRSSGGIEVALHDLGGSGPTLLVAHATGFHGRAYEPMAHELAGSFHTIAVDLRGHGDATAPASGDFAWSGFADDVRAAVDALAAGPRYAFGHSKGGAALTLVELAAPGTFAGLYLFEPIITPTRTDGPTENPMATIARRRRATFESFPAAIANYAAKAPMERMRSDALEAYVHHGFRELADGTVTLKCTPEHEARTFEMSTSHDAFDRLPELALAVTVAASGDGGMPATVAPLVSERIAGARLERFDDLSHFGPFEDPARVARAVTGALLGP